MERRAVYLTFAAAVFGGGIAALIGVTALQSDSHYFSPLLYGGIAGVLIGVGWMLWLLFTTAGGVQPKQGAEPRRKTTFDIEGGQDVSIRGTKSSADTFARIRNVKELSFDDNEHDPISRN